MEELKLGTAIQTPGGFSPVINHQHREAESIVEYLRLITADGNVELTGSHYLEVNAVTVPASQAKVGDLLTHSSGKHSEIIQIEKFQGRGAYAPYTGTDYFYVNGFKVNEFASPCPLSVCRYSTMPLRWLHEHTGEGFHPYLALLLKMDRFIGENWFYQFLYSLARSYS
jgi:hypothetical protein